MKYGGRFLRSSDFGCFVQIQPLVSNGICHKFYFEVLLFLLSLYHKMDAKSENLLFRFTSLEFLLSALLSGFKDK